LREYSGANFFGGLFHLKGQPITLIMQVEWIYYDGKLLVDEIFDYSELDKLMDKINKKYSVKIEMGRHNTSNLLHYLEYYNDGSIEIVRSRFARDIDLMKYK